MTDMKIKVFLEEADVKKDFIPDHTENELKCPFCQQELKHEKITGIYCCPTIFIDCPLGSGTGAFGTKALWQELIRTRKALDVAIKYIKHTQKVSPFWFNRLATKTLEQITALEQKDAK